MYNTPQIKSFMEEESSSAMYNFVPAISTIFAIVLPNVMIVSSLSEK